MDFKVGDRVKVLVSSFPYQIGKEGVVAKTNGSNRKVGVVLDGEDTVRYWRSGKNGDELLILKKGLYVLEQGLYAVMTENELCYVWLTKDEAEFRAKVLAADYPGEEFFVVKAETKFFVESTPVKEEKL